MIKDKEKIDSNEIKGVGLKPFPIPVLIYSRASTNDQESGISTQIDVVTKKIESLGFRSIIETFTDEGFSGDISPEERPAFKELLKFTKDFNLQNSSGPINCIFCIFLWFITIDDELWA